MIDICFTSCNCRLQFLVHYHIIKFSGSWPWACLYAYHWEAKPPFTLHMRQFYKRMYPESWQQTSNLSDAKLANQRKIKEICRHKGEKHIALKWPVIYNHPELASTMLYTHTHKSRYRKTWQVMKNVVKPNRLDTVGKGDLCLQRKNW